MADLPVGPHRLARREAASLHRSRHAGHPLADPLPALGRAPAARDARARDDLRGHLDARAGAAALGARPRGRRRARDRGHRRPPRLVGRAVRPRRRPGGRRDAPAPGRRQQLAPVRIPDDPGRRAPRGARRSGGQVAADHGRGRGDRVERRPPGRRRVRHHGAARGRGRVVLRRRDRAPLDVGAARRRRAARGAGARREPLVGDPAAPGAPAGAAGGGGPADRSRRRHRRRPARPARHRRRAGLPRPLPEALGGGAAGRRPGSSAPVDARLGAGAPPGHLHRHRHVARRAARDRRPHQRRRARRLLRLRRLPRHPAARRGRGRGQGDAGARRRPADAGDPPDRAARRRAGGAGGSPRRRAFRSPTSAPASSSSRGC